MGIKALRIAFAGLAATTLLALASPAFAQVGSFTDVLYVPNFLEGTVSVIDRNTNTVIDTVVLSPLAGPIVVLASADGTRAYVVQAFDNSVAVLDTANRTVGSQIPTGDTPMGAAINEDGSRLYVTNFASESITIIDTASGSVAGTIDLPSGIPLPSFPIGISFTPDFTELWVTSQFPGRVDIIDPATDQVVDTIPLNGAAPVDVEFSPDGSVAYVAGHLAESLGIPDVISIIDTATRAMISEVRSIDDPDLGAGVAAVAIGANGAAYASNSGPVDNFQPIPPFTDTVTKVDLAGNTTRIPSGGLSPSGSSVSADGRYIYVSNAASGTVGVIDTTDDTLVASITVGTFPGFSTSFVQPEAAPDPGDVDPVDNVTTKKLLVDKRKNKVQFDFTYALGGGSNGIDPDTEDVFMQFDGLWINVPAGSFKQKGRRRWTFKGKIDGVKLNLKFDLERNGDWRFRGTVTKAFVDTITNLVAVTFRIGDDGHTEDMTATIIG